MTSGGGKRRGKSKKTVRKAKASSRGSKVPKITSRKTAPRSVKSAVLKHGQAVEYIGGEKTLRKGRHKIFETGPLTIGKSGIAVVRAVVDGLEKLPPKTKLSYNLEVRFNDRGGERKSVVSENIALPILENIRLSKRDKRLKRTKKGKWQSIVYGLLREKVFQPIIAEFGFVSAKRVPKGPKGPRSYEGIKTRAKILERIERHRKSQDTRFRVTIQREVF